MKFFNENYFAEIHTKKVNEDVEILPNKIVVPKICIALSKTYSYFSYETLVIIFADEG